MRKGSALQYLTILFTLCTLLLSCTRHTTRSVTTIEELNDSRITIGYNEGHSSATVLPLVFPKAKLLSFNENLTGYEAIRRGKIDAFAFDRVQMELAMKNGLTGVKILGDFGEQTEVGVGLSPVSSIPDLENKINAFLAELRADGTLDDLYKRWVLQGEETMPAIPVAREPRLHLRVGTTGIAHPYSYYKGTELTGFDIELARRFAAYLNADLEFKIYNYGSIITAARSGDIDCIMANLNATPERRESIAFSTPVYIEKNAIMVHDDDGGASTVKEKSLSPAHGNIPPQFQNMTLKYTSKEELQKSDQLVLGMHTGFVMVDRLTRELFPQAKIEYYKTNADMAYLVASGKLDGFINDEPVIRYAALEVPKLGYIHCGLDTMNIVACFQKNEKGASLRDEFNQYVKKWQEDGTLKKTDDLWLSNDEKKKVVDLESLRNPKGKKGTIRFATEAQCPPFDYIKDGKIVGYEIDVIARFCREAGYALTVQDVPFDSLIMGLETGMYDCVAACLSDTPANRESLNLSEALYVSELVMAVEIMDDGKSLQKTAEAAAPQKEDFTSPSDYNRPDVTLGVKTGTVMDRITQEAFPLAKIEHYNASPEMVVRVVQGKIDGYLSDEPIIRYIESTTPGITHLKERIRSQDYAFGFPKSDRGKMLCGQMNEFLKKIKADGTLEKIDATWFGTDKSQQKVDLKSFSGENGSVNLVTDATLTPFSYIQDSEYAGYEIDIAARFCREYGYTLKITDTRFASIIPGLVSGTYDMAAALIGVTDERKESLLFSDADYQGGMVLAVKKADGQSLSDLNKAGVTIGVQTGTVFDDLVAEVFPKAKTQHYTMNIDMAKLIVQGRLDCMIADEPTAKLLCANIKGLDYIKEYAEKAAFAFAFPKTEKGERLKAQMDEFILQSKQNGLITELEDIWFGNDESKKTIDMSSLSGEKGTIRLATSAEYAPFEYVKDNAVVGYDIDWAVRFAREYGYKIEIADMNLDAVIPSVASQKYDFAASGLTITEERKQSVNFSLPNYEGGAVAVVKAAATASETNETAQDGTRNVFFSSLASSFEKTFVRESRWKLVANGIGITMLLAILSALFGTVLGFVLCGLRLTHNKIADSLTLIYIRLMQGLPMVVLLMILFYIVFAKTGLSGIWVAVIGFGMNFGAYVSEMIRTGILAVDKGQMEAALALGYPKSKAFVKMILPQAARHFLPVYQGEFISLVKMTSVVGYIAIQDLTKASDIIRSRTYEAFFPLITTAIIYFIISWLLTRILTALQRWIEPKKSGRM